MITEDDITSAWLISDTSSLSEGQVPFRAIWEKSG